MATTGSLSPRAPALVALALAFALAGPAPARALTLAQLARESELVVHARVEGAVPGTEQVALRVVRAWKRPGEVGPLVALAVPRVDGRPREQAWLAPGSEWIVFAIRVDAGSWSLVDPEQGLVAADGPSATDLAAALELALDPPSDPRALAAAHGALLGRGELPTASAVATLLERPDVLRALPATTASRVMALVETRRVAPPIAAELLRLIGALGPPGADAFLVAVVASEAPPVVVAAAEEALPLVRTASTGETVVHAIGAASADAVPGLLRLAGASGAGVVVPSVHDHLARGPFGTRLEAVRACGRLADPRSIEPLVAAAAREPALARDVADALASIGTPAAREALARLRPGAPRP